MAAAIEKQRRINDQFAKHMFNKCEGYSLFIARIRDQLA